MQGGAGDDVYIIDDLNDAIAEDPGAGSDAVQIAFSYPAREQF